MSKRDPIAFKRIQMTMTERDVEIAAALSYVMASTAKIRRQRDLAELLHKRFGLVVSSYELKTAMQTNNIKLVKVDGESEKFYAKLAPPINSSGSIVPRELAEYRLITLIQAHVTDIKCKVDKVALLTEEGYGHVISRAVRDLPHKEIAWTMSNDNTCVIECMLSDDALWLYEQFMHFSGLRIDSSYAEYDPEEMWDGITDGE